ncbi:hypothetical protein C8J57DRAFT_1220088 [Mycena rebaudengoi]|nr:hypothetical protein C8J57DRAFT_1220088 [Mycena rebaudengoi]
MVGGAEKREDGWTSARDVREDERRGRRKERRGQDKSNQKNAAHRDGYGSRRRWDVVREGIYKAGVRWGGEEWKQKARMRIAGDKKDGMAAVTEQGRAVRALWREEGRNAARDAQKGRRKDRDLGGRRPTHSADASAHAAASVVLFPRGGGGGVMLRGDVYARTGTVQAAAGLTGAAQTPHIGVAQTLCKGAGPAGRRRGSMQRVSGGCGGRGCSLDLFDAIDSDYTIVVTYSNIVTYWQFMYAVISMEGVKMIDIGEQQ